MKLTVKNTNTFDFGFIGEGGLEFIIEQYYDHEKGFRTTAVNDEFDIVVSYASEIEFETELNGEINFMRAYYGNRDESQLSESGITIKAFVNTMDRWYES